MNAQITILVPVYNEVENLFRFKDAVDSFLNQSPIKCKILFINDGSTDESLPMLNQICDSNEDYNLISFDKNYGLSVALKAGFDACTTRWVGYIDADLQTTPEDFIQYFPYLEEYQMVNGIRLHREDSFVKRASSKSANAFRRWMIHDNASDTGCPLKIMDTEVMKRVPFFKGLHRFLPALVLLQGGKVKEIPVRHFPRLAGKSKFTLWNRLLNPFIDTLAFRWMQKRNIRYSVKQTNLHS